MSVIAEKYYTVSEAAQRLGLSPQRVRKLIEQGHLAAEKVHERLWIIKNKSLDSFANTDRPSGVHAGKRSA